MTRSWVRGRLKARDGLDCQKRITPSRALVFSIVMANQRGSNLSAPWFKIRFMISLFSSALLVSSGSAGELDKHLFQGDPGAGRLAQSQVPGQQLLDSLRLQTENSV